MSSARHMVRVNVETADSSESDPPDGGYGWLCVGSCFAVNCFTWGAVASYGIYLSHYLSKDVFPEATPVDFALIGGFNFAFAMLAAPFVTILTRKYSHRPPMLAGITLLAVGYISASFSTRVWQLYIGQGALVGLGVGFTYIPSIAIISQWFQKRRSLANGISAAGSGIGGLIFSFMTEAVIQNVSLAWSFRVTALVSCSMLLVATAVMKNRNEAIRPHQRGLDLKLVRQTDVQLLLSWAFISMLGYVVLLYTLPDFAHSIGLSSGQAATINALLNLGTAIGRPFIGILSDKYGRFEIALALTFACGVSCFTIWLPSTTYGATIVFSIVSGAILGVFWVTIGPLCVEVAGLRELQSLLSLSWISVILPTTFSEVIALKIRRSDSQREYLYPQIFSGLSYLCASVCLFALRRLKRKPTSLPTS